MKMGEYYEPSNQPEILPDNNIDSVVSSDNFKEEKKRFSIGKKSTVIAILVALLCFLATGGVLAYKYVWLAPERVLDRAYQKMQNVKTYGYSMNFSLVLKQDGTSDILQTLLTPNVYTLTMDGTADITDPQNVKQDSTISIKAPLELASLDLRTIGKTYYIKINRIPDLGIDGVDQYINQWIQIDYEKLLKDFYSEKEAQELGNNIGQVPENWLSIFENSSPIKITKELSSSELNGQSMFRYQFEIDKEAFKEMVVELQKSWGNEDLGPNATEYINKAIDDMQFSKGEIFVGKRDNYLHKIKFGVSDVLGEASIGLDIDMEFKDHNKEVEVSAPLDYKSIEEVLGGLGYGGLVNPGTQFASARDAQRNADLLSINNTIYQYAAEHNGYLPDNDGNDSKSSFPTKLTCIGTASECFDLGSAGGDDSIVPTYLPSIPIDPSIGSNDNTGYYIFLDVNGRVEASASAELSVEPITVIR